MPYHDMFSDRNYSGLDEDIRIGVDRLLDDADANQWLWAYLVTVASDPGQNYIVVRSELVNKYNLDWISDQHMGEDTALEIIAVVVLRMLLELD